MSDSFFGDVNSFLNDVQDTVGNVQGIVSEAQAGGGGEVPPQGGAVSGFNPFSGVPMWVWIGGGAAIILALWWSTKKR